MNVLTILIPLFLVFALGALTVYLKIFRSEDSAIFSRYDFYVGFPILLFYTLAHTDFAKISNGPLLLGNVINLAIVGGLMIVIALWLKLPRQWLGMLAIAAVYGNTAYMGIPVSQQLFGADGASYASVITGIVGVFVLSVGILLVEYFHSKKPNVAGILFHLIKNPIIVSILLGIAASALRITLPEALDNFLGMVSKSASPIALFAIGMFLVGKRLPAKKSTILLLCFMNLIALPVVTYFIGQWLGLSGVPFKVTVLEAAMPLAATNFVIAQKYGIAEDVISGAIVLSTLLSLATIAGAMLILN